MKKMITAATLATLLTASCAVYVANAEEKGPEAPQAQQENKEKNDFELEGADEIFENLSAQARQGQAQNQAQDQKPTQNQAQDQKPQQGQAQNQAQQGQAPVQKPTANQAQQGQAPVQKPTQSQTRQRQAQNQKPRKEKEFGPNWQIGDYWIVESVNRQSQSSEQRVGRPVRWLFEVVGMARVQGRDCYQTKITAMENSPAAPIAHIWVDSETGALVRVATQTYVRGQWVERVQSFQGQDGKAAPVFGIVPCLPLDMPLFAENGAKSVGEVESFYTAVGDSDAQPQDGAKSAGGAKSFAYRVKTTTTRVPGPGAKGSVDFKALKIEGAKGLDQAVEVKMDAGPKTSRQIWTPGTPWPVYSANETSESRLIESNLVSPSDVEQQ